MTMNDHTVQFGELVVAAFDKAAQSSSDPREVSRLAARTVLHILRRARKAANTPRLLPAPDEDES